MAEVSDQARAVVGAARAALRLGWAVFSQLLIRFVWVGTGRSISSLLSLPQLLRRPQGTEKAYLPPVFSRSEGRR